MSRHYTEKHQAEMRANAASNQSNFRDYELAAMSAFRAGRDAELAALRKELTTVGHSNELNALRAQLAAVSATLGKAMTDLGPATPVMDPSGQYPAGTNPGQPGFPYLPGQPGFPNQPGSNPGSQYPNVPGQTGYVSGQPGYPLNLAGQPGIEGQPGHPGFSGQVNHPSQLTQPSQYPNVPGQPGYPGQQQAYPGVTNPLSQNVNVGTHGELGTAGLPNLPNLPNQQNVPNLPSDLRTDSGDLRNDSGDLRNESMRAAVVSDNERARLEAEKDAAATRAGNPMPPARRR